MINIVKIEEFLMEFVDTNTSKSLLDFLVFYM